MSRIVNGAFQWETQSRDRIERRQVPEEGPEDGCGHKRLWS